MRDKKQIRLCGVKRDWKTNPERQRHAELKPVSEGKDERGKKMVISQCQKCGEFVSG